MRLNTLLLASVATLALQAPALPNALAGEHELFDFSDKSRWLVRARAINVSPDEDSTTSIGGEVSASDTVVPELDFSYFFTPNVAAELILATAPHDINATGTALGYLDLGDVWLLPPTLTLQYHFRPEATFRPYVGAGLNYTFFYNEDPVDVASIDYDNGMGYALQAGFDYGLDEHWAINVDLKRLWLNVDASINGGAVTADVDLDPWIMGVGVAYRF